jgi:glycosyltransferase involved in cell wall biosynthesis
VPDIRPFLGSATVVVVPLRSGGGTRLKILEAWAMRKAVMNILLADSPEEFARQCHQVLTQTDLRHRIAEGGYRTAMELYDWARVGEQLFAAYDEAITTGPR